MPPFLFCFEFFPYPFYQFPKIFFIGNEFA